MMSRQPSREHGSCTTAEVIDKRKAAIIRVADCRMSSDFELYDTVPAIMQKPGFDT